LGCPTIFSDQTSGNELIDDKTDGLLINPYDPDSIAAAIVRIIQDPVFAQKLGKNGRIKAQMFTANRMGAESIEFYKACIEQYKNGKGNRKQ
jgi:glycosyltransferase involved in cell wall biosynthesis